VSDNKPSLDPIAVLLEPGERAPMDKSDQSTAAGLVGLAYLARVACEERRHKQCLEATKAILKIDPEHKEAISIQSAIRTELDQELANAQANARDARQKDDQALYARATAALRRIIDVDPDNLEARTLLHDTVAASYFRVPPEATPLPRHDSWKFKVSPRVLMAISAGVVAVGSLVILYQSGWFEVFARGKTTPATSSTALLDQALAAPPPADMVVAAAAAPPASSPLRLEDSDRMLRAVAPSAPTMPKPAAAANTSPAPMGTLAVSAAVPVEIYRGDVNLGSTPTTLQLAEGPQTLEYRYQGLRQTLTHMITRDQTTTATISILIKVQINAQPWAQVILDGPNMTALGQTPLGDVNVPIGSVLVFQNPAFPDKRYRVKPTDTAIRITFP
jgi:hypothetical protein